MVEVDPAFKSITRSTTNFLIWRMEQFNLVPVPRDKYGAFYTGDSYLLLTMYTKDEPAHPEMKIREAKGSGMEMRVHFWLGTESSQDEKGAIAYKAVELDDYLGGSPVQVREVQEHESKQFLNYFRKKGGTNDSIRYLKGGAKSGFTHVEHVHKPRLFQVKGKVSPRIKEIDIGWDKMNKGDSFIMDAGPVMFVWVGAESSRTERRKAMEFAREMGADRGAKAQQICVEDGEERELEETLKLFEEFLPLKNKDCLKPASHAEPDDAFELNAAAQLKLWKVSNEGGSMQMTEVSEKPLKRKMLDSLDCFIVDNGVAGIFVWCGRKANLEEKKSAMKNATDFVKDRGYPDHVSVVKVVENAETAEFKTLFKVWDTPRLPGDKPQTNNRIARTVQTKFDATTLHGNPAIASETRMVDDGSGKTIIWRVEKQGNTFDLVPLDKKYHNLNLGSDNKKSFGQLFGGDCYVIHYTYMVNGRENHIIYFWLGTKSGQDEQIVAARKTVELDDSLDGMAVQIRVVQGKEPPHFMAIFQGKLIVFDGGKASGTQTQDEGPGDNFLLHVRGTSQLNTKAVQVALTAESLNSNDVFVLFTKKNGIHVWAGKGCTGDEREMAKGIASISPKGYNMLIEGQEKDEFWDLLGGEKEYSKSARLAEEESEHPPRLYQCSNASGRFLVTPVGEFSQVDLEPDDVFMLDTYDSIYLWIGNDSRQDEIEASVEAAIEYIKSDPTGRDEGTPIIKLKQGFEPPDFVGFFGAWDRDLWSSGKSYDEMKKHFGNSLSIEEVDKNTLTNGEVSFSDVTKYSLSELLRNPPPDGVNPRQKEKYLKDDDFEKVFKMSYEKFVTLAGWKQTQLKKDAKLF